MEDAFDTLPEELLVIILSFVPLETLITGNIDLVCKRFRFKLREDGFWKLLCKQWWATKGFYDKKFDLEWVVRESKKPWRYYASFFAYESRPSGLTWRIRKDSYDEERIEIGNMLNGELSK